MKKVYQSIVDKNSGDCWSAAIASLLNLHLEDVPHFNSWEHQNWNVYYDFLLDNGYKEVAFLYNPCRWIIDKRYSKPDEDYSLTQLKKYSGVDSHFYATVWSPKFVHDSLYYTHAVIIDKNFNIVHDPNPNYRKINKYPFANTLSFNGILTVSVIEKLNV